jgi:hypothetical protein
LGEGRFEVVGDFLSENVGRGKGVGVGEAFILDPEEVEAELVALEQLFVVKRASTASNARQSCVGVAASGGRESASFNCRWSLSETLSGRVPA